MHIVTDINTPLLLRKPCALTIGNFDGVHLGHLSLLQHLRSLLPKDGILTVFTFTNHPSHVLTHLAPIPFIYTVEHKLKILKENQVDYVLLSPFTKELAQTPFDLFLTQLKETVGFSYLVLGKGASFGKNKEGTEENVKQFAKQCGFHVEYLPKLHVDHETLSSGNIRTLIAEAKFAQVKQCLGRPYSIYAPLIFQNQHYHMKLNQLCLPPSGSYPVSVCIEEKNHLANAHIDRHSQLIRIEFIDPISIEHTSLAEIIFYAQEPR